MKLTSIAAYSVPYLSAGFIAAVCLSQIIDRSGFGSPATSIGMALYGASLSTIACLLVRTLRLPRNL